MLRKMFFSLRARLIALVLLAMVPAFAVILYSGLEQRSHAAQDATDESLQIVRLAQNDYEGLIDSARQILTVLAQLPQVRASDPAACNAFMANLLKQNPRYTSLNAVRLNGDVYCNAVPLSAPLNVADRGYFQRVLQTRDFVVGEFVIARATGKAALPFVYPVLDASGQMQAVVLTAIDLTWLNQLATQTNLPVGSSFTIIDRNGTILARYPDAEQWVGKSGADAPIVRTILAQRGEGAAESVGVDGVSRLYAFTPLGGGQDPSAYIYVGIPSSIVYANADQALARNLLSLGAVAMLALLAAWFGGDIFLLRRVNVLVNATQRLAAGDLSARMSVRGGVSELSQLAHAFDGMADSLQQREAERKRAEAETLRRNRELTTLYAISRATAQSLNLDETLNGALEATLGALDVEVGGVYFVEPDGETMTLRVHRGFSDEFVENIRRIRLGEGISGRAAAERKPVVLDVPDYPTERLAPLIVREGFQTVASTPLLSAGELVGALNVATRRTRAFPPEELELLTTIGQQLGSAVQNAQLYQKLQSELAERTRAEEALHKSEEHYRTLAEASQDMIFVLGPDDIFQYMNNVTARQLGSTPDQLIGQPLARLFPPETVAQQQRGLRAVFETGQAVQRETHIIFPGHAVWVSTWLAPLRDAAGSVQAVMGVARDITERKRAEQALTQKAEELDRSNRELERFAYVASHDLQEPLRMVTSYLQLIERRYGDRLDGDAREFMGYAVDGANRMKALINDLLAYSRVGTHGKPFGAVDCETSLAQATANLQVAIEEHAAVVTHDPLPAVTGDAGQLIQLFQNLIGNAIKFHGAEPPRIHVSARQTFEVSETSKVWEFSVRDNGIGIAAQYFDRIFTIFQRLHTRDEYSGTGIGLAISKRIVERHGGRIWVESQPGQGATFWFTIPA